MTQGSQVLFIVMSTSFVTPFMGSALNVAIPAVGAEFGASAVLLSWVATSYILATAACLLPAGRFADIRGRRPVYISGIVLFSTATLLCGLAPSIAFLIFFRVCQGIGSALIFSTGMAIVASAFPPDQRGKVLGFVTAATYIGLSVGPVLGGLISFHLGWRAIFYIAAPLGVLTAIVAFRRLHREAAPSSGESFDIVGSLLYMSGLVATMYGFSFLLTQTAAVWVLGGGIVSLLVFLAYESRCKHPLIDLTLFTGNIAFAFSNLAAMINYSATFAAGFLVSLYLQVVLGLDSRAAGWILLSQPVLMAAFSPFAGRLSDRIEPRLVASAGMALTAVGLFAFSFVDASTPIGWVIADLALMGFGIAFFSSPNNNAIMGSIGKEKYGVAASSLATMRMVGQAVSMALTALAIAYYVGGIGLGAESAPMILKSIQTSMLIFTGLSMVAILFSLKRGRVRPSAVEKG